jgi:ubiquitin C-terminal hydrolase
VFDLSYGEWYLYFSLDVAYLCQTSTTYNVFSTLSLPIPHTKHGKVSLQRCLDAFFNTEILEKDDAWLVVAILIMLMIY